MVLFNPLLVSRSGVMIILVIILSTNSNVIVYTGNLTISVQFLLYLLFLVKYRTWYVYFYM